MQAHVQTFAQLMTERRGRQLEAWMTAADAAPELHSFIAGLRRDQDAVTAALTLPWSSGAVEATSTASFCGIRLSIGSGIPGRSLSGASRSGLGGLLDLASAGRVSGPDECAPVAWILAAPVLELLDRDGIRDPFDERRDGRGDFEELPPPSSTPTRPSVWTSQRTGVEACSPNQSKYQPREESAHMFWPRS